jgi:26S proteasome regulatory subunit T1
MGKMDDFVEEKEAPIKALDETDIAFLKNYGLGPYAASIKRVEEDIKSIMKKVSDVSGIKESDTGLAPPSRWDLVSDKQMMQEEQPLQVARCTKIINPNTDDAKYVINVKQIAKFVVGLGDKVAPTDIEEGMRVGVDRNKYQIQIPLPPKIDPSVTMMTVEEKPDVTYSDIGGSKEQIEKMREVVELPLLHPEKFVQLGIDPPKGVLCYGPPGGGRGRGVGEGPAAAGGQRAGGDGTRGGRGQGAQRRRGARAGGRCGPPFSSSKAPAAGGAGADGSASCRRGLRGCCSGWRQAQQLGAWRSARSPLLLPPSHPCSRHGEDPAGARGREPHGRVLHPRDRQRAGAEVRGRGEPAGGRARVVGGRGPARLRAVRAGRRGSTAVVQRLRGSGVRQLCSRVSRGALAARAAAAPACQRPRRPRRD